MNCDLMLTTNSCRFCLTTTHNAVPIFNDRKNFFCVEGKLTNLDEILKCLEIKIRNELHLPNMICQECKRCLVSFFILKRNFQENESVLLGDGSDCLDNESKEKDEPCLAKDMNNKLRDEFDPILNAFLKEHQGEPLEITMYTDKLVIGLQNKSAW